MSASQKHWVGIGLICLAFLIFATVFIIRDGWVAVESLVFLVVVVGLAIGGAVLLSKSIEK